MSLKAIFARIPSLAFKLGMLSVIALLGWVGISTDHTPATHGNVAVHVSVGMNAAYAGGWTGAIDQQSGNGLVEFANGAVDFVFALFNPLLVLAGWLLTPDWVFGEVFGLRSALHDLWVLVSNVVYIVFAFLLVAIAFMNIYGSEQSAWQIKTKLPKLIIGVISVPFTWFLVSAVTSVSTILTASMIQMPADLLKWAQANFELSIPESCTVDFTQTPFDKKDSSSGSTAENFTAGDFVKCGEPKKTTIDKFFRSDKSAYGVLNVYAYSIFNFDELKKIKGANMTSVKTLMGVGLQVLIWLVFFVVFTLLLLAIIAALFSRAIMLWIYAIFSPAFSLNYFFEGKLPSGLGEKFGISNLISLALVPVLVAGSLSFGLLFLGVAKNANGTSTSEYVISNNCPDQKDCQQIQIGKEGTIIKFVGTPIGVKKAAEDGVATKNYLLDGIFGKIIIETLALVVLWMAVMAALKSNKITESAIEPIASFGAQLGGLLKKLPSLVPIVPTGKHQFSSVSAVSAGWKQFINAIESSQSLRGQELGNRLATTFGVSADKITQAIKTLAIQYQNPPTKPDALKAINNMDGAMGAKSIQEYMRVPSTARAEKANYVERLPDNIMGKDQREKIANWLKSNNEAEVRKAMYDLDHALGGHGVISDGANSIDAYLAGRVNNTTATNQQNAGNNPAVTININNTPHNVALSGRSSISNSWIDLTDSDKTALKDVLSSIINDADASKKALKETFSLDDTKANELYNKIKS